MEKRNRKLYMITLTVNQFVTQRKKHVFWYHWVQNIGILCISPFISYCLWWWCWGHCKFISMLHNKTNVIYYTHRMLEISFISPGSRTGYGASSFCTQFPLQTLNSLLTRARCVGGHLKLIRGDSVENGLDEELTGISLTSLLFRRRLTGI